MQSLDYAQIQQKPEIYQSLLGVFEDIANKIEMKSDFSVHHPDYKPLKLPTEVVERFQKMPDQMQHKYLSLQLRNFLYGIYYNGSMRSVLALDSEESNLPLDLENNTVLGIDVEFYQRLHESNCGKGYFDSGWSVLKEESDGSLVVTQGSLKLHIKRDKHLQPSQQKAVVGDLVSIQLPKNRVQSGFYIAVGNAGIYRIENDKDKQTTTVRIYFNLTPEGAVAIMASLTEQLNQIAIPFSFKVLYNPKDYKRYDSGVLYFDKRDYEAVAQVLKATYLEHQMHFKPETLLFTMQLAPGLGLAEEPDQRFAEQESFGMNRCQIVANGLLAVFQKGENSSEEKIKAILGQFDFMGIDLSKAHLNANSENIYLSEKKFEMNK